MARKPKPRYPLPESNFRFRCYRTPLAGFVEVLGVQHRLVDGLSGGVGFIGIVVALLARLTPIAVLPTAIAFGGMTVGMDAMQRSSGIPSSLLYVVQSLIVLFVLIGDMLRHYRIRPAALGILSRRPAPTSGGR